HHVRDRRPGAHPHDDPRRHPPQVREAAEDGGRRPGWKDRAGPGREGRAMSVTQEQVLSALRAVQDPDLHKDIVTLGFVKDVRISGAEVDFTIELTTPACPVRDEMKAEAERRVAALPGVEVARAKMTADVKARGGFGRQAVPGIRNIVAVGAGKGGVGKSTT